MSAAPAAPARRRALNRQPCGGGARPTPPLATLSRSPHPSRHGPCPRVPARRAAPRVENFHPQRFAQIPLDYLERKLSLRCKNWFVSELARGKENSNKRDHWDQLSQVVPIPWLPRCLGHPGSWGEARCLRLVSKNAKVCRTVLGLLPMTSGLFISELLWSLPIELCSRYTGKAL